MRSSLNVRSRRVLSGLLAITICLLAGGTILSSLTNASPAPGNPKLTATGFPIVEPTVRYGVALDTFLIEENTIEYGQTLSDILLGHGMGAQEAFDAANSFNAMLDVRNLRAGRPYQILDDEDTPGPDFLVYVPSVYRYLRLDLQGTGRDEYATLPVTMSEQLAAGEVETSLWNAMVGAGHSFALTDKMEDALQWSVDFYHVQPGDAFQLVYEQEYVEGEEAGFGRVRAARYSTGGKDIYAFYFESEDSTQAGYFGLDGQPMKATFLKAPVRYSRISSRYNLRRFHPVQRRVKPHLGTDYAAPYGTPIVAVADGVITRSGRTGGNGIFVKIKHDKRFDTQYLHMQKRAPGMVVGKRVSQGDVIGYVGSTGLATGPHVCFRFWDHGKQVDHTKMDFQDAEPMPEEYLPEFFQVRDDYLAKLNSVGSPVEDTAKK
ncbi:murein DD-endopeptidase MepM/ murein hydrolase activator NlpD [Lewinella marina]|uniref:Peptidase M23 n=1 Tax=Neolewinella marina TaxID=438751 RepID=A0A2G0CF66_9BACT|nr:peptidoglycan DD-metalloendopeptidase family protein [Neolewinella marina]NJB85697.1 murein DD-endopeptidase MepM/ murein hydrolase activator NlpD [Neolewinella marina]PHK98623.1 peptidase M23 [Neolewinella marina]